MYTDSRYILWSGPANLRFGDRNLALQCCAYQEADGAGDLRIACKDPLEALQPFDLFGSNNLLLEVAGVVEPMTVIVVHDNKDREGSSFTLTPLRNPTWLGAGRNLHSGRFVVVNFASYWINHPAKLSFTLEACGWICQFISVGDKSLEIPLSKSEGQWRFTHQVEFRRVDHSSFTEQDAEIFIWKLLLFLSFCRGHWVGHSLAVGLDEVGESSFVQLGTGRVSEWRGTDSWLDEHHGASMVILFESFFTKLQNQDWLDAIRHVVYWFVRADTNTAGPDGSCILLQAALERLAWHILVRDGGALSENAFDKLSAAEQLRRMLEKLAIPTTIPLGLRELTALGQSQSLDGPGVFTHIRNRLTHPPKISAPAIRFPYYEAYCLAQWYVELAILSSCGYRGEYSNRTTMSRWRGQVESVPWTQ